MAPLFAEVCAKLAEAERQDMNLTVSAGEERGEVGTQKERIRPGEVDVPPSPGMDTVDRPLEALSPLHLINE